MKLIHLNKTLGHLDTANYIITSDFKVPIEMIRYYLKKRKNVIENNYLFEQTWDIDTLSPNLVVILIFLKQASNCSIKI